MANATAPVIQINEGNVGIGTTEPGDKLNVEGNILLGTTDKIGWRYSSGNASYNFITGEDQILTLTGGTWSTSGAQTAVRIKTQQGVKLTIRNDGNVGIGTTSPSSELQVGNFGSAETPEIRVGGGTSSRITLNTGSSSGTFAQVGFGGSQYASENTAGKVKYIHTTQNTPTLDVMIFRVNYSDRMVINGSGALELSNYTSTSYKSGVTSINPLQNFYPSNGVGSDTTTDLAVDQQGNVVRTTQEATWKLTRAQVDGLTTSTAGTTLLSAPGSSDLFIIIEKVTFLIQFVYNGNQMSTSQQYQIIQDGNVADEIAVINGSRINDIAYSGGNTNTSGIYEHDTGYSTLNRTYKPNTATTIRRVNGGALNTAISTMSIKIRYRVYDKTTF